MAKAKKIKYLITGGLGFIGHNLVKQLQSQKHDVQVIDALTTYNVIDAKELEDLYNQRLKQININTQIYKEDICTPELDTVFENFKPDVVVHLASFPREAAVKANPIEAARTMCVGTANLLDCAKRHNTKKFVYVSTGKYEDKDNADGQYSIWKIAGEELVKQNGVPYVIVRPGQVYGPRNISTDLIGNYFKKANSKDTLYVNGASHDLIYVDDCVAGIIQATGANNKTYNISLITKSIKEKDIADKIIKIVKQGKIKEKAHLNHKNYELDCSAAKKELKFAPNITIDKGLKLYHDWLKSTS